MKKGQAPPPQPEPVQEDPLKDVPQTGFGRFEYINGTLFVGNWKLLNGQKVKQGQGKITFSGTTSNEIGIEEYEGDWEDDLMHGYGTYKYTSGAVYTGQWVKGQMHGQGIMRYADGSSYDGQWEQNLMSGDGIYIDPDQIKWEGIFVKGTFESKVQKKLQQEKLMKVKRKAYEEKAKEFFVHFQETFAKSDKKTFKDNLTPFFANAETCGEFVNDPYPKYEEKAPDKWNDWFKQLNGEGKCLITALSSKEDSRIIPSANIQVEQLREKAGGQLVEIENKVGEKMFQLVLSNFNGVTLNLEEKLQLELAFAQLKGDTSFDELLFWGKICGTVKDYYIALGLDYTNHDNGFPKKVFYWSSSSNFVFSALPEVQEKHRAKFEQMNTYFSGEFDRTIIEGVGQGTVIDEDAGIILPPKGVTELDRLSYVVNTIEDNCSAVPKGSFKLTPLLEVKRNEAFKGLSKEEAFDVKNWYHLRKLQNKAKIEQLQREESIYNNDFLDNVCEDYPKKSWNVLRDGTDTVATLRSQLWPGYYAFHKVKTQLHGSVYIGEGLRNNDLPFMI